MALVCWSGGADSTLILHDLAVRYKGKKDKPDEHGLRALSVIHSQVPCQPQSRAARRKIAAKFRKTGLAFRHATLAFKGSGDFDMPGNSGGLYQPPLWLAAAVGYLEPDEDLYMGYIRGDDIWHHADQLRGAFRCLQDIGGRTGKLVTPLEWFHKSDVIRELRRANLLRHCWHCEGAGDAELRPCGRCASCESHHVGLFRLRRFGGGLGATLARPACPDVFGDEELQERPPPRKRARKRASGRKKP